jgi:HAD-superfamily hydrolase, subfamily IIB
MVFSDIDGTLLTTEHTISPGTKQAVLACKERNIPFILVSARMPDGMFPIQRTLTIHDPLVCYGGALIINEDEIRNPLLNISMNTQLVIHLYTLISKRFPDICFSAYSINTWLVADPENTWIQQEREIAGTPAHPFEFLIGSNLPPINKILCMGEPNRIAAFEKLLREQKTEATFYQSKPTYLEITDKKASKAVALDFLMNRSGIRREETMAFGDNFNDIEMLRFAGKGLAMDNAPDGVKAAADGVTSSNNQDGIAVGLKKFNVI